MENNTPRIIHFDYGSFLVLYKLELKAVIGRHLQKCWFFGCVSVQRWDFVHLHGNVLKGAHQETLVYHKMFLCHKTHQNKGIQKLERCHPILKEASRTTKLWVPTTSVFQLYCSNSFHFLSRESPVLNGLKVLKRVCWNSMWKSKKDFNLMYWLDSEAQIPPSIS